MQAPYRAISIAATACLTIAACETPAPSAIPGTQSLLSSGDPFVQQTTAPVMTHPSQGPVTQVPGAQAVLTNSEDGISFWLSTGNLVPRNAHTVWWVVFNQPENCLTRPCTPADVLTRADAVKGDIGYATGRYFEGTATTFTARLAKGPLAGGWFGYGLSNPRGAEVHLVIHDHGPRLPQLARNMITTFRGGCTNASLPSAFPPVAFADGIPGPNTCRLVQFAILQQ